MWLRPDTRVRACVLGTYPVSSTALHTRFASSGSTDETRFTARDTVAIDTCARFATSRILTVVRLRFCELFLPLFMEQVDCNLFRCF